jgi:tRNA (guanine37-N1)-methyltransferase
LRFNFEKVYWCSRLQPERDRLLSQFHKGQTLLDLFCGAGPLSIRTAMKGLNVVANDLNPATSEYLRLNAERNGVEGRVLVLNQCARKVVREWTSGAVEARPERFRRVHHVFMNLPVLAIEFLD